LLSVGATAWTTRSSAVRGNPFSTADINVNGLDALIPRTCEIGSAAAEIARLSTVPHEADSSSHGIAGKKIEASRHVDAKYGPGIALAKPA
jgi:hypothetical protein